MTLFPFLVLSLYSLGHQLESFFGELRTDLLDLCVVNNVPRWKFPIIIPFALKGKHGGFKGVDQYRASRIEIRTSTPCWVQTDGEIPGKLDRIELTVEKQKLRFII